MNEKCITTFRFQNFDIWKKAVEIGEKLINIANILEERKLYRFAEQIRGAALSISNNIAEGSGSLSNKDFANFLNIARRSVFEDANMVIVFALQGYIAPELREEILADLEQESRMITAFIKKLKS